MREIIFRGICVDETPEFNRGTWVYGDLIRFGGKCYIHPQANRVSVKNGLGRIIVMHEVDPETVGQWTGLVDKNGERIFEGDMFRSDYSDTYCVEWEDKSCGFEPFSDSVRNCGHCGGGESPEYGEVISKLI